MKGYSKYLDKRMWVIYKIYNDNNEVYVGKTCDWHNRMSSYRNLRSTKQPLLNESFIKNGYDNHTVEILDTFFSDQSYAKGKEIFWIRSCMSNRYKYPDQKGLNCTDGAGGLGVIHSKERKENQRQRMMGRTTSEYQKQRAREVHKGNKYNLGRKHTDEHKKKIHDKITGKKRTDTQIENYINTKRKLVGIPIIQSDSEGVFIREFSCKQEVIETLKISEPTVNRLINNSNKKYKWSKNKDIFLSLK